MLSAELLMQGFFESLTGLGSTYAVLIYVVTLALLKEKESSRILLVSTVLTRVVVDISKVIISKPRPGEVEMITSSFPSGHGALGLMVFAVPSYQYKELRIWFILASLVAVSRVFIGVHYISDVFAGAIIGYLIGALTVRKLNE